jgi:hypothetical protein
MFCRNLTTFDIHMTFPGCQVDGGGVHLAYYVLVLVLSIHAHFAPLVAPKHAIYVK